MKRYIAVLIIAIMFFPIVSGSIWVYPDTVFYSGAFTVTVNQATELEYFEVGDNYTNVSYDGVTYENYTYVYDATSQYPIVEQMGYFSLGYYQTNVTVDVWSPSDASTENVYLRFISNTSETLLNVSNPSYDQINSTYRRYYHIYNPSNSLDLDWVDVNLSVWIEIGNATFTVRGGINFESLFEVYQLDPPYNASGDYDLNTNYVNLTWTYGNSSDQVLVLRNNASYPADPADGWIRQNNTLRWYNTSSPALSERYYGLFSYNASSFSYAYASCPWGLINMSCYNESDPSHAIFFDLIIQDQGLTQSYEGLQLASPTYLDYVDIPFGENTIFQVDNDSGYDQRIYHIDLVENQWTNLSFYLPIGLSEGGDPPVWNPNTSTSRLYQLTVVGQQGEYTSPPIEDVEVWIRRYINSTDTFENVTTLITDANGQCEAYLYPGQLYFITLSKENYQTTTDEYIPSDSIFTHTFRILPEEDESPIEDYDVFNEIVTFEITMQMNNRLTIHYIDGNSSTVDTTIVVYRINGSEYERVHTDLRSGEQAFWFNVTGINTSNFYYVKLWWNNTANFDISPPIGRTVNPITGPHRSFDLDDRVSSIMGNFTINYQNVGWQNVIAVALGIGALALFGSYNTGLGIITCGFAMGFSWAIIDWWTYNTVNPLVVVAIPLVFLIGGVYLYTKDPGRRL